LRGRRLSCIGYLWWLRSLMLHIDMCAPRKQVSHLAVGVEPRGH